VLNSGSSKETRFDEPKRYSRKIEAAQKSDKQVYNENVSTEYRIIQGGQNSL
jgi:hypothetical protein